MSLLHIPIRILAADPAEAQAFADILAPGGQGGILALAGAQERPLAVLVCPSGDPVSAQGFPAVMLGHAVDEPIGRSLSLPARMADILEALEALAQAASGFSAPRHLSGWRLEPARLSVQTPDDRSVALTDTEARLLACLFDAQGDNVSRDALLQRVWGYKPGLDTHTLETHIYRLRRKLERDPANPVLIVTTAEGYRFAA